MQRKNMKQDEKTSFIIETVDYYSIDDAISHIGMGWFQYRLLILTGLIWAADSMEIMLLSFLAPKLKSEWDLKPPQDGMIGAVVFVGILIGSLTFAITSDKYGRRQTVVIGTFLCSLFGFLSGLAPNIIIMLILRFVVGFAVGCVPVAYTLFAEYIPAEYRGRILILQTGLWSFGALFSVALAYICLSIIDSWQWYLILSAVPFVIATLLSIKYLPESIRWYLVKGDTDKVIEILEEIAEMNGGTLPSGAELRPVQNANVKRGQITDLFSSSYRYNSIFSLSVFSLLVFCYYGISFISARYFENISSAAKDEYWMMAISTASELPSILVGYVVLDRIGRKRTLNLSVGVFAVCLFLLMGFEGSFIGDSETKVVAVMVVSIARMQINLAFNTIYIYFSETYPTTIRSTALGIASVFGRIAGIITSFTAEDTSIKKAITLYFITAVILNILTFLLKKDEPGAEMASTPPNESVYDQNEEVIELVQNDTMRTNENSASL